jgi:hypothetical protein
MDTPAPCGWHVKVPGKDEQSEVVVQPGKQMLLLFESVTQKFCWPALLVPQPVAGAHVSPHHEPLHWPWAHPADVAHGSPMTPPVVDAGPQTMPVPATSC